MREFLIAGNWKMNGSMAANKDLVAGIIDGVPAGGGFSLLVCPPFPYVAAVAAQAHGSAVSVGAQNVSEHDKGAFTGEVAPAMLRELGCDYVIVGHSERRSLYGETSAQVAAKFKAAQAVGMTPILCVGETLEEREAGTTEAVVDEQLDAVLDAAGIGAFGTAVIAYEPVWAIGTGKTATPDQAQEVHAFIRKRVAISHGDAVAAAQRVLYGGSVKPDNIASLMVQADIDGALVGGACLQAESFLGIIHYPRS